MSILKNKLHTRLMQQQAGDGGDSGGGTELSPEVQALISKAVGEATAGLKANNAALLNEKKSLQQNLQKFDGIDVDAVNAIMKQFASDEESGLLKAGKVEEVMAKRTERMSADFGKKLQAESEARARAEAKAAKLADGTLAGKLRDAAIKAGALPEALEDIVLRARGTWHLNDDGDLVAMSGEEVVLGKDGKTPLAASEWAESLREVAPHLWPKAQGMGATGGSSASGRNTYNPAKLGGSKSERTASIAALLNATK